MQSVGKTGLLSQVDKALTWQPVRLAAQPRLSRQDPKGTDSTDIQVLSQMDSSRNEAWSRTTRDRTRGSDWTCILASQYILVRYGRHKGCDRFSHTISSVKGLEIHIIEEEDQIEPFGEGMTNPQLVYSNKLYHICVFYLYGFNLEHGFYILRAMIV